MLDLESEVNQGPGFYSHWGNIFYKFYNPNLHNITRTDRIELKRKNRNDDSVKM